MRNQFIKTAVVCALMLIGLAHIASAQAPAPAPRGDIVVANPTYVTIPLEIMVNRPAAEVWKRVGKYCDIGEWLRIACTITSGKDGEFGAVRSVGGRSPGGKNRAVLHLHATREGGPAVQPLSRHARGAAGDGDDVEARLHADVR